MFFTWDIFFLNLLYNSSLSVADIPLSDVDVDVDCTSIFNFLILFLNIIILSINDVELLSILSATNLFEISLHLFK